MLIHPTIDMLRELGLHGIPFYSMRDSPPQRSKSAAYLPRLQNGTEELPRPLVLRIAEELVGRPCSAILKP